MLNNINPGDYNSRLHNSVVCYDGYPVNLQVLNQNEFTVSPIHTESKFSSKTIRPNDVKLDISTPDLGYFNIEPGGVKMAAYIERHPVRRWRQGLCSTNCSVHLLSGDAHGRRAREEIHPYLFTKGFEDMIQGRYPSVPEGLKSLTDKKVNSVALSRNIAVSRKDDIFNVWYKRDKVGYMSPGKNIVKVPSEPMAYIVSKFLRELPWVVE